MTDPQIAVVMLGIFVFSILLGFPIAFTLMAMGIFFGYYAYYDADRMQSVFDNRVFDLLVNQTYSVMANDVLVAVPLFLFMGYIVERANLVDRLFSTLQIAARHMPGSMAVAALATCAMFATASGIIGAVVTLMGLLAFPAMLKARYDTSFSAGVICAGGCLGILIPPSIMLIVYAAAASMSVVRLYAGAILPGFMLAGLYMIYVVGRAWLNPKLAPKPTQAQVEELGKGNIVLMMMTSFLPLAFLILAVLGAILFGLATPTEAASMGAMGGILLASGYRIGSIRTGEIIPEWVDNGRAKVNDWWFSVGYGGVLAAAAFVAYFLARFFAHGVFDTPLPEERALPIGPGVGIALAAVLTLMTRYMSSVLAATTAVLGPVVFLAVLELLGLLGLTLPLDYGILFAICLAISIAPAILARPETPLLAIGIGAYGPALYVALKFFVWALGAASWLLGIVSLDFSGAAVERLQVLISANSGIIFVALTLVALAHLFTRHRNSGAAQLFPLLAPGQDAIRKLFEFGGKAGVVGLGLSVGYILMFRVFDLSEQFASHQFSPWTFEVGFFVTLFGYMGWKGIDKDGLRESVYLTVRTSAMVCWLFVGSWTFSSVFSYLGGHDLIQQFVLGMDLSPIMFLILAQIIIFLLGWPLEWSEIIIIFVPIFLPMLPHFGIDPLFFGILVALNLQTSFLTPPMAMAAYYLKGVAPPHVQLITIFKGVLPFLSMVFLAMIILYTFPEIALWLPKVVYGR